eukprot:CAMPEP_0114460936 /NCGR_PEP_ID=MMETSP0104-20121206/6011_1 /TAXON_ID=37642 ORGANISM="Paraphysomonas imperforata, Strain PA2" /NCGR_SAMPLE_ID=MMETSP0104 /ASSEMBLY_ACC=CAM_ASM_000202 /LENGTH=164 /DNA_ID=CAMNT_0001633681 /DNA_START=446 /DNA_END=940 /DNA_ORIENTATION=+
MKWSVAAWCAHARPSQSLAPPEREGNTRAQRQRPEAEKPLTPAANDKVPSKSREVSGTSTAGGKAKFSFLATLDKKMARRNSAATATSMSSGGHKRKESGDFMAFSTSPASGSSSGAKMSSSSGGLNLLELEASNKKKRRKSQGAAETGAATSLGSLQQLLQKR